MLLLIPLVCSCFKDNPEIEYAKVYLPLATRATNGVFNASFTADKDTTFIVGAYCSGSIMTPVDVDVTLALATEEFAAAKAEKPALASYQLLPADCYDIVPSDMKVTIKAKTERADISVNFHTSKFTPGTNYVLPLKVAEVSEYEISESYNVLFFGVSAN